MAKRAGAFKTSKNVPMPLQTLESETPQTITESHVIVAATSAVAEPAFSQPNLLNMETPHRCSDFTASVTSTSQCLLNESHPRFGNTSADTEGCILLGTARNGFDEVINSRAAYNAFFPKLQAAIDNGERVSITIVAATAVGATAVA